MTKSCSTVHEPRELAPGFYMIQECITSENLIDDWTTNMPEWVRYEPGQEVHIPVNIYVLDGEESMMFDAGSHAHPEQIIGGVEKVLADGKLDYVAISHGEAPHAGNLPHVMDAFPDVSVISIDHASPEHSMFGLDDAKLVEPGELLDLGDFRVRFVEAVFPDTAMTLWLFEETMRALFTVDWMGVPHSEQECHTLARELGPPSEISVGRSVDFHARVLPWLEYADPDAVTETIDRIVEHYHPNALAPAHGFFIDDDAETYVRQEKQVVSRIAEEGSEDYFFA